MPKLGEYDKTQGKIFKIMHYKNPTATEFILKIFYNDYDGVRHATRLQFRPGTQAEKVKLWIKEIATFTGTPREIEDDYSFKASHKRVTRKNHKLLAKDIIEKFAVVQMYLILSGIMDIAADNADNPRQFEKFSSLSKRYKELSEAGTKEFFDFMNPFTRTFIDGKISEVKDSVAASISPGGLFAGEQLNLVERQLSSNCKGAFQHVRVDYNNDPEGGEIPNDELDKR